MRDAERSAGFVVVSMPAELDVANALAAEQQLRAAFRPGVKVVVADMTSTVFCDSSGIHALVIAYRHAVAHDAQLQVAVPHDNVVRVMKIVGLDQLVPIYPSLAAAQADGPAGSVPGG